MVDLARHIRARGGFARLADVSGFKQVSSNPDFPTVRWSGDLDIAPETLYCEVAGLPSAAMSRESPPGYGWKK